MIFIIFCNHMIDIIIFLVLYDIIYWKLYWIFIDLIFKKLKSYFDYD